MALRDGVAVGVVELGEEADLSGDGNLGGVVVHVITADAVINTGLTAPWGVEPLDPGGFVVAIDERDAGEDLTGDGDSEDQVPHVWTVDEGVRNLAVSGLAVPGFTRGVWVQVYEEGERRDLNNDGDIGYEHVVHLWDAVRAWHNTRWAAGSVTPLPDGTVILGVFEEEQGRTDFNGDGATDGHFAVWLGPEGAEVIGPAYTDR